MGEQLRLALSSTPSRSRLRKTLGKRHVTDLLIGNVFKDALDEVWEPLYETQRELVEKKMEPMPMASAG